MEGANFFRTHYQMQRLIRRLNKIVITIIIGNFMLHSFHRLNKITIAIMISEFVLHFDQQMPDVRLRVAVEFDFPKLSRANDDIKLSPSL